MVVRQCPAVRYIIIATRARVEHLSRASRDVAMVLEVLRQGGEVGHLTKVGDEVIHASGVWSSASEEGRPRRTADGERTHRVLEHSCARIPGQRIHGRRVHERCGIVVRRILWSQVVHNKKQDIQPLVVAGARDTA